MAAPRGHTDSFVSTFVTRRTGAAQAAFGSNSFIATCNDWITAGSSLRRLGEWLRSRQVVTMLVVIDPRSIWRRGTTKRPRHEPLLAVDESQRRLRAAAGLRRDIMKVGSRDA
jgi:hypothetical protein